MTEPSTDGQCELLHAWGVAEEVQGFGPLHYIFTKQITALKLCLGHSHGGTRERRRGNVTRRQHADRMQQHCYSTKPEQQERIEAYYLRSHDGPAVQLLPHLVKRDACGQAT
jgi:hypothetical protein